MSIVVRDSLTHKLVVGGSELAINAIILITDEPLLLLHAFDSSDCGLDAVDGALVQCIS